MHVRQRRRGERGQMIPLLAVFAVVLVGCMALATDLSITTHYKRQLQNVTDAAALAGARALPSSPASSDQQQAVVNALDVMHNSYGWTPSPVNWASTLAGQGCDDGQCSVTVCAGLTGTRSCTVNVTAAGASPFVLMINTPPLGASVSSYNGDAHRVEVTMRQQSRAFFAGIFGQSNNTDAAESVALHVPPGQPFPFALYSRTYVQDGNQAEVIQGNIYADRYIAPQSNGHAGVCAATQSDGTRGFIFLGYPQQGDGSPPYANDGQSTTHAPTVSDGVACSTANPPSGGSVEMSGSPATSADCVAAFPGGSTGTTITYDHTDGVCEMNPPPSPPAVAPPPNLPTYASTVCGAAGLVSGAYQPHEYACSTGAALTVDHPLGAGIYEIDAGAATGGCDVIMDGSVTTLSGVTFYLKGGAGICITLPSGVTISQTPYNAGTGDPGDGRYVVLSDNVAAPSITLNSGGGGSSSGIWSVTGVLWLPTGSVTCNNKTAIEDQGQVIVNSWNDQGGNHQNSSVSYNSSLTPSQAESLQLTE